MRPATASIRFPQGIFANLRNNLLEDLSKEAFALLFGKTERLGKSHIIKVVGVRYPGPADYEGRGQAHLRLKREYIYKLLVEMQRSGQANTIIDVHTHPFSKRGVAFSGVDDHDEITFHKWLTDTLGEEVYYASIVLSQTDYSARLWDRVGNQSLGEPARIKTQTTQERWLSTDDRESFAGASLEASNPKNGYLARSALALGLDTLRQIMYNQSIAVIGVGGLGSVIAENLIHTGFQEVSLIDPDRVEITNLNRIVGAYYNDAIQNRLKVDVVKSHLKRIHPKAKVHAYAVGVEDEKVLPVLAHADWILVCTDSHLSRFTAQKIALRYGVPLISVGVNIQVENGQISDMSGEVITARFGDGLCLNCLGRVNHTKIAAEQHKGEFLGNELIQRGYVSGQDVKEPAVKTLNAILGALTVEQLLNQYTQRQTHESIQVYENNRNACIYPDTASVRDRRLDCFHCSSFG